MLSGTTEGAATAYSLPTPRDRRSRPQRWRDAVETLRELQDEYQEWLDNLPETLQSTALADKLDEVCSLDLDQLDVDLPRGFGRD